MYNYKCILSKTVIIYNNITLNKLNNKFTIFFHNLLDHCVLRTALLWGEQYFMTSVSSALLSFMMPPFL